MGILVVPEGVSREEAISFIRVKYDLSYQAARESTDDLLFLDELKRFNPELSKEGLTACLMENFNFSKEDVREFVDRCRIINGKRLTKSVSPSPLMDESSNEQAISNLMKDWNLSKADATKLLEESAMFELASQCILNDKVLVFREEAPHLYMVDRDAIKKMD